MGQHENATKEIISRGRFLIKMHSRLMKCYNINGMDYLNVIFGSYRTIKKA